MDDRDNRDKPMVFINRDTNETPHERFHRVTTIPIPMPIAIEDTVTITEQLEMEVHELREFLSPVSKVSTYNMKKQLERLEIDIPNIEHAIASPKTMPEFRSKLEVILPQRKQQRQQLILYIEGREKLRMIETEVKKKEAREYYHNKGAQRRRDLKFFLRTKELTPGMKERRLFLDFEKSGMAKYIDFKDWKASQIAQGRIKEEVYIQRTKSEAELREEFYERIVLPEESPDYLPYGAPTIENEQQFIQHRQHGKNYYWNNNTKELEQEI